MKTCPDTDETNCRPPGVEAVLPIYQGNEVNHSTIHPRFPVCCDQCLLRKALPQSVAASPYSHPPMAPWQAPIPHRPHISRIPRLWRLKRVHVSEGRMKYVGVSSCCLSNALVEYLMISVVQNTIIVTSIPLEYIKHHNMRR